MASGRAVVGTPQPSQAAPPPPRSPQNSSGFSSALAVWSRPSAVTMSAETNEVVAAETVLAHQPAEAAAQGETGDAGRASAYTAVVAEAGAPSSAQGEESTEP
jgi:hypothetical protein